MELTEEEKSWLQSFATVAPEAPTAPPDLRRQEGEALDAYQARLEAARPFIQLRPGTQEMNDLAVSAMAPTEPQRSIGTIEDVLRTVPGGLSRGVTGLLGLPGTIDDLITSGLVGTGIMQPLPEGMSDANPLSADALNRYAGAATMGATDYQPQTTAGEYAGTISEFMPMAAAAGAPFMFGVVPGAASEFAGQMTEGTAAEPWARLGAAVAAPTVANAVAHPSSILRALYGSGNPDPIRREMVQTLDDAGVRMTAGQQVGNETIVRREMMTGTGSQMIDDQAEAFTRAALATTGENADRAIPTVLSAARTRIGQVFDDVQSGVDITPTPAITQAVDDIAATYAETVASQVPAIRNIADAIKAAAATGDDIAASELARWRRVINPLVTSSDDATREAARSLREVLDDSLQSQLTAMGRVDDVARLAEARSQYRNLLAIIRAATGPGSDTAMGLLSPSGLRNAVVGQDRTAYALGNRGDVADLARAAEAILRRPANSGTPSGLLAQGVPQMMATGLGGYIGNVIGDSPTAAALGAAAGTFAPLLYRAGLMTRPVQNAIATGGPSMIPEGMSAISGGLLAQ